MGVTGEGGKGLGGMGGGGRGAEGGGRGERGEEMQALGKKRDQKWGGGRTGQRGCCSVRCAVGESIAAVHEVLGLGSPTEVDIAGEWLGLWESLGGGLWARRPVTHNRGR